MISRNSSKQRFLSISSSHVFSGSQQRLNKRGAVEGACRGTGARGHGISQARSNHTRCTHSLGGYSVEGRPLVADVRVEIGPELDEEERLCGALLVQLLQAALLLGKLVLDLAHVDRLQKNSSEVRG